MTIACVRSLRQNTAADRIVVYIPESEQDEIPPDKIETFEELATTEYGPVPIDGFPISTKVAAFARVAEYDDDWYVLLDADTIVLNPFKHLLDTDAQLRALPHQVARKPGFIPMMTSGVRYMKTKDGIILGGLLSQASIISLYIQFITAG